MTGARQLLDMTVGRLAYWWMPTGDGFVMVCQQHGAADRTGDDDRRIAAAAAAIVVLTNEHLVSVKPFTANLFNDQIKSIK